MQQRTPYPYDTNQYQQQFYGNQTGPQNNYSYLNRPRGGLSQGLEQSEIDFLRTSVEQNNWNVTEQEHLQSKCTHRELNGVSANVEGPNGEIRCTICGEQYNFFEGEIEEVIAAVKKITDIIQTTKCLYLDAPKEFVQNYYTFLPILKKLPMLFIKARENFLSHDQLSYVAPVMGNMYPNSYNSWKVFDTMTGNPGMGYYNGPGYQQQYPFNQQPSYQYPNQNNIGYTGNWDQQNMYQQPPIYNADGFSNWNPTGNMYQNPNQNPFAYGTPMGVQGEAPSVGMIPPGQQQQGLQYPYAPPHPNMMMNNQQGNNQQNQNIQQTQNTQQDAEVVQTKSFDV